MSTVTKLTAKHQTTIPADVRTALGLKAGDLVEFSVEGRTVMLERRLRRGLRDQVSLIRAKSRGAAAKSVWSPAATGSKESRAYRVLF